MSALLAVLSLAGAARAQTPPPSGLRAELLADIDALEARYVPLAEAIPAERYGWRPMAGVRTVSEVYMHVADTNHYLATLVGVAPAAALPYRAELGSLERITDRGAVRQALAASLAHARLAVQQTPDNALDRTVTLWGAETTVRSALLGMITHMHEHLGQSIAYARSIGIVPPWSREGG